MLVLRALMWITRALDISAQEHGKQTILPHETTKYYRRSKSDLHHLYTAYMSDTIRVLVPSSKNENDPDQGLP